jgi:hypothetical protein
MKINIVNILPISVMTLTIPILVDLRDSCSRKSSRRCYILEFYPNCKP